MLNRLANGPAVAANRRTGDTAKQRNGGPAKRRTGEFKVPRSPVRRFPVSRFRRFPGSPFRNAPALVSPLVHWMISIEEMPGFKGLTRAATQWTAPVQRSTGLANGQPRTTPVKLLGSRPLHNLAGRVGFMRNPREKPIKPSPPTPRFLMAGRAVLAGRGDPGVSLISLIPHPWLLTLSCNRDKIRILLPNRRFYNDPMEILEKRPW